MNKNTLLIIIVLAFIVGCSKEDISLDSSKSRMYNNLLLGSDILGSDKSMYVVDKACKDTTLETFLYREVTLYNHKYQKLLTAEGTLAGTWDGARARLDRWFIGAMWKHAQQWSFRSVLLLPKYGGWTYAISNKIGWGKWRDLAIDIEDYRSDNGQRKTYPLKLFRDPDNSANAGVFEFILIECRREGKHPRGLLVHRGTDRIIRVNEEEYGDRPMVLFGEKYNPANKDNYDDKYLWEAEPRTYK
ncbi:MAG: hypothetical protein ACQPRJ_02270 [Solitalea-like symbiont of Acarus siro]